MDCVLRMTPSSICSLPKVSLFNYYCHNIHTKPRFIAKKALQNSHKRCRFLVLIPPFPHGRNTSSQQYRAEQSRILSTGIRATSLGKMATDFSYEMRKNMDRIMEIGGHMKKEFRREDVFGLDSVGRLNVSIFYGENTKWWVSEADRIFSRNLLSEAAKVEAVTACFDREVWDWFQQIDKIRPVVTWEELKSLMLDRFSKNKVSMNEKPGLEMRNFDGSKVGEWLIRAEQYFVENPMTEEEKVEEATAYFDSKAWAWFEGANQIRTIQNWSDLKEGLLEIFLPKRDGAFDDDLPVWSRRNQVTASVLPDEEWREKKIKIAVRTEVTITDLLREKRMGSGLISGLVHDFGLPRACFEETHVAASFSGEKCLVSNPNYIWDPGNNMAQHLDGRAEIKTIWDHSGPTPSGSLVKMRAPKGKLAPSVRSQQCFTYNTQSASNWYQSSHPSVQQSNPMLSSVPDFGSELVDNGLSQEEGESKSVYVKNIPFSVTGQDILQDQEFKNLLSGICYEFVELKDMQSALNPINWLHPTQASKSVVIVHNFLYLQNSVFKFSQGVLEVSNVQNQSSFRNSIDFEHQLKVKKGMHLRCEEEKWVDPIEVSVNMMVKLLPLKIMQSCRKIGHQEVVVWVEQIDYRTVQIFIPVGMVQTWGTLIICSTGYGVFMGAILMLLSHSFGLQYHFDALIAKDGIAKEVVWLYGILNFVNDPTFTLRTR